MTHALRADVRGNEALTDQQFTARATQRTRAAQLAVAFLGQVCGGVENALAAGTALRLAPARARLACPRPRH